MSMFANSGVGSVGLLMQNANYDGTNYVRINTDLASRYYQALGVQTFSHAVTGSAGSTIAWVDDFVISATGAATFSSTLAVTGAATLSGSASGGATIDGSVSISIANGAAYTNSVYQGLILVTDKTSNQTCLALVNYNAAATIIAQTGSQYTGTVDTASKVNIFVSSGTLYVQNNLSTRNFGITVIKGG